MIILYLSDCLSTNLPTFVNDFCYHHWFLVEIPRVISKQANWKEIEPSIAPTYTENLQEDFPQPAQFWMCDRHCTSILQRIWCRTKWSRHGIDTWWNIMQPLNRKKFPSFAAHAEVERTVCQVRQARYRSALSNFSVFKTKSHCVAKAGIESTPTNGNLLASFSQVLELQAWATRPGCVI